MKIKNYWRLTNHLSLQNSFDKGPGKGTGGREQCHCPIVRLQLLCTVQSDTVRTSQRTQCVFLRTTPL